MPGKRNDVEENAADREIAVTRVALAWALVLVILFWITSTPPSTESRWVRILIGGDLGGGDDSAQRECAEGAETISASLAMPQVFDVARRMMGEAWADPKPFAMTATFAGEDGKARLSMRMVLGPAEARDEYVQDGGWRALQTAGGAIKAGCQLTG
jgi:hypothetical protein